MIASSHPQLRAQEVTNQATPAATLPDAPEADRYPEAIVVPEVEKTAPVVMESDTQSKTGDRYVLDGNVLIIYGNRKVEADHIEYDSATGELEATGHLKATGGANNEIINASHGTVNLNKQTGRFYDVSGSVGLKNSGHNKMVYANGHPFLFTGRVVVKKGPQEYEVYDGTVTSCQLEHPDWLLYAGKFEVSDEMASAHNSVFHLFNIPLLYMPYVTHPVDTEGRQSGLMIPVIGESSTKGLILGEQIYFAINRSTDLTVGAEYFSSRGWSQSAMFHYRGRDTDFVTARYSGLLDRGYVTGGVYVNQGGQDVTFSGRHDFGRPAASTPASEETVAGQQAALADAAPAHTRIVSSMEYLSSYPYREAFTENFNEAVSTDILSFAYGVHEADGFESDVRADRYQGLKRVAVPATPTTPAIPAQEIRIFHVPALEMYSTDHAIGNSGLLWNFESSASGLKRVQPDFVSSGVTQRFDLHPEISYPLKLGEWKFLPSLGVRETLYSRSLKPPTNPTDPSVEHRGGLSRSNVEAQVDIRPPVIERTFDSKFVEKLFGNDVRHTIEPELKYRYVGGVDNFLKVLRFDDIDVVSDTNELQYGVTQRLFLRPVKGKKAKPCKVAEKEKDTDQTQEEDDPEAASNKCGAREWISWRLTQKYFFDKNFGGAVVDGRRNIFDTTLNLSGVAFLTEAREISPLVSRLRVRTSAHMDVEWDFDLDTGAKKFTSNNVLVDLHEGNAFGGLSYARLNAPGRSYTQGTASLVSDFSQLRLLAGYGSPTKVGLGVAANVGLDLNLGQMQYGALQTSYNWDCCGFSVEYRKYELGSVRNENAYRFNFTLANIGSAGNLRRAERLF
ncbi:MULTISPECIES: LPS-assembly protein LptD [Acidobacteriaceae]|uniref:LPS-assembly protein LptD n=1 Tax=Acidobacteriaceae TaxID=204434 RepID=UPI0020B150E7|nr:MULTISPECIES: LPS assembly protein LptD [Acidobacteriaceae]MDW5264815.1 LPS assembly protein LptD [Edaphobacter sp.]